MRANARESLPLPEQGERWAVFLDFDGTLTEIVATPDRVRVDPALPGTLLQCQAALTGALALVSGRTLAELDNYLAPARLPAAGLHGLVLRDTTGNVTHHEPPAGELHALRSRLAGLAAQEPRLIVEDKGAAIALHYRQAPERETQCTALVESALVDLDGYEILRGKMVIEVKPAAGDKGQAIEWFMAEPPFAGRRPFFAGDDVTDEAGFEVVARLGGIGIKVGDGRSCARYRTPSVAALLAWLEKLPARMGASETEEPYLT